MDCRDLEMLMQMAIDKTLSDAGRELLRAHLAECQDCAANFAEYERLEALLQEQLTIVAAPADLKTNVMAALPAASAWVKPAPVVWSKPAQRSTFRRFLPAISLATAAAALLLIAGLSGWFGADAPDLTNEFPVAQVDPDTQDNDDVTVPDNTTNDDQTTDNNGTDEPTNDNTTDNNDDTPSVENPQTYAGGILLPQVAHSTESHGSYSLYTLASHEDYDAVLPRVSGNVVTYYLIAGDYYLEWEADLARKGEPVYIGETESLPDVATIAGFSDKSAEYGYTYISAISPDNTKQALNLDGGDEGFWLVDRTTADSEPVLIDGDGGGKIVSWAPDGAKVLYTTYNGALHVYYPDQDMILDLFDGEVESVCWAADSKNIVFAAEDEDTGNLSIFSVIVP
jgi:hypothetical protein